MRKRRSKTARWLAARWKELLAEHGNACSNPNCTSVAGLEFAHVKPTGLNGTGRGKWNRYYDIKRNPECYILLCKSCHVYFDSNDGELPVPAECDTVPF